MVGLYPITVTLIQAVARWQALAKIKCGIPLYTIMPKLVTRETVIEQGGARGEIEGVRHFIAYVWYSSKCGENLEVKGDCGFFFSGCGRTQELQLTSYNIALPLQSSKICARVIFTSIANARFSKNHILRIHNLRDLWHIWVVFSPNTPKCYNVLAHSTYSAAHGCFLEDTEKMTLRCILEKK